ncbi:acyl carrier protein [Paenibacillus sp. GbtcB18]|nr:phosphopantetheine-binding protein [Paenibacillus sp. GbtcB18]
MMNIQDKIKQFIMEASDGNVTPEDLERVGDDIGRLGLDSLAKIKIVVLLEEAYDIETEVEEISPEVLNSISRLAEFIEEEVQKVSV